ncbi:MAG: hypothetical protein GXO96_04360 [Nitrospirae bacterium]|nr:hypothetical protein [Candidatus Manganitrophaceae bacterium]
MARIQENRALRVITPLPENALLLRSMSCDEQLGFHGALTEFEATLVPWFWLLTRNFDCRIFQKKTVPDIVKESNHGR